MLHYVTFLQCWMDTVVTTCLLARDALRFVVFCGNDKMSGFLDLHIHNEMITKSAETVLPCVVGYCLVS